MSNHQFCDVARYKKIVWDLSIIPSFQWRDERGLFALFQTIRASGKYFESECDKANGITLSTKQVDALDEILEIAMEFRDVLTRLLGFGWVLSMMRQYPTQSDSVPLARIAFQGLARFDYFYAGLVMKMTLPAKLWRTSSRSKRVRILTEELTEILFQH